MEVVARAVVDTAAAVEGVTNGFRHVGRGVGPPLNPSDHASPDAELRLTTASIGGTVTYDQRD